MTPTTNLLSTSDTAPSPEQVIAPVVLFTEAASRQIQRILSRKRQEAPDVFVRVGVKGGGCSGMSYVLEPDTEFDERDRTWVTSDGLRIVVDMRSMEFVSGMTIDYSIKNLMEGGFLFQNPNAAKSCGCGTSFTPR